MNDFTKKELIALEHALYTQIEEHIPSELETSPLLLKLQSLIDNYCEHEMCRNKNCRLSTHPSTVECMQ